MNYKRLMFRSMLLTLLAVCFASCSSDDEAEYEGWTPPLTSTQGAFILNNGNYGGDDASLAFYNKETKASNPTVFESMNDGKRLGDTAQDLVIVGDYMFIAVHGSRLVYVTDKQAKVVKKIVSEKSGQTQQPRALTSDSKYVYIAYFDGYVARVDLKSLELDVNQIKVGRNPEDICVANNKLYVANSGGMDFNTSVGYDKTVSVIDIPSFTKLTDVPVVVNPSKVEADKNGNVYVISMGNYSDIPNTLQKIDVNNKVTSIGSASIMKIHPDGEKLYTIYAQMEMVGAAATTEYRVYNVNTEKFEDAPFVNNDVTFSASPISLDFDPASKEVYVGTSNYISNAEMYIISPKGALVNHFNTGGLNPVGAFFVQ